jgi:ech hydrogenase subunit A
MHTIGFLLLFPLLPAILLLVIGNQALRSGIVRISAVVIGAVSIYTAWKFLGGAPKYFVIDYPWMEKAFFAVEIALALYLLYRCKNIVAKEFWIPLLIIAQAAITIWIELSHKIPHVKHSFYIDNFSIIMVLIIGIIGTIICVYALSYMRDYQHHHPAIADRRRFFFFLLFMFLSAMFGVVLCNNIQWLFLFWEVTTLCSFEMIGYSQTDEAKRNSYLALGFNSLGGLSFACAIFYCVFYMPTPTLELSSLCAVGTAGVLIPAVLISFAGLTKSAQMPFSSWLLGAMIAPTPVSALLHSSTMVKAGVFVIVKFAPVLQGTMAGEFIAIIGGVSFVLTSILAVTQRNAKLVLAYSTIANLGLVVMCAGVGSYEALWAGILLIIFHAISKGLLFLGVGTIEHKTGSRDIEDMDGLITTRPWLAFVMVVGILGMFLAPFGMLISKWVCLEAFIQADPILAVLLAFGSAPTLFFWAKWLGKLLTASLDKSKSADRINRDENSALSILAVLTIAVCVLFPFGSRGMIEPYIRNLYGETISLSSGNLAIMFLMFGMMLFLFLSFFVVKTESTKSTVYLGGLNIAGKPAFFTGAMLAEKETRNYNYYLKNFFNEKVITNGGNIIAIVIYIITLGVLCL